MRKTLILFFFFAGIIQSLFAQQPLDKIWRKSHQALVYRIPADTAEKYITKGIAEIDHYLLHQPVARFNIEYANYDSLPIGNYLILFVRDTMMEASYYSRSSVLTYVVNNQVKPQLLLRNNEGKIFADASVWVNKKPTVFNPVTSTYLVVSNNPNNAVVKIVAGNDTSFTQLSVSREKLLSLKKQKAQRFRNTVFGRIISWLPDKIGAMFEKKYYSSRKRKKSNTRGSGKGYVLFNKPKYFPSDTIKLKAYLLNKKGKQYKKEVDIYLSYINKYNTVNRFITSVKPVSPGAYVYEFPTGDTLPNDTRYNVRFVDKKKKLIHSNYFNIEDYLLDEVTSYNIESQQKKYYAGDTLRFSTSAKDANDMPVMDGRVELTVIAKQVNNFYDEKVFVPDTLWREEKNLLVQEETKFKIPTETFPNADIELKAVAIFRNSNNEIVQQTTEVSYLSNESYIDVKEENGLLTAIFYRNAKPVTAKGFMESSLTKDSIPVEFPYSVKIDPQVEDYYFHINDEKGKHIAEIRFYPDAGYRINFSNGQRLDTVSFTLYNPKKIPVYYSLFEKDKEIFSSSSSEENIVWQQKMPVGKVYYLRWEYYWGGIEKSGRESIALLSKLMSADIGGLSTVYPGQKDTVTVKLKDYMQKEAAGVNLSAMSYNTQFASDIRVATPPYIEKFKGKRPLIYDELETDIISAKKSFSLGKHQGWRKSFGLDTMLYYQFLFPDSNMYMVKTRVEQLIPQLSVYAVKQGVPQEIYMLYVNRQLVYYNGITEKDLNVVSRFPGYAQIVIRLKDKYIETDSIYLQPFYKHDIVFDIDKPGKNFKVSDADNFWTPKEKEILNNQVLRIENNYRNNNGFVWQDDKAYYLGSNSEHIVGPFINYDSIQFYKPGDFDFKFSFEPGYRYRVSPQVVRLEKIPLFSFKDKVYLPAKTANWIMGDTIRQLPVINYEKRKSARPFLEQWGNNFFENYLTSARLQLQLPKDSLIAFTVLYNNAADYRVFWGSMTAINMMRPGNYTLILVTKGFQFLVVKNIDVPRPGTFCIKFDKAIYESNNEIISEIIEQQTRRREEAEAKESEKRKEEQSKNNLYKTPQMTLSPGTGMISGKIIDEKGGNFIPGVSIYLKGYRVFGAVNQADGTFRLAGIPAGKYIVVFSTIGYEMLEKEISINDGDYITVDAALKMSSHSMSEVIVTSYGVTRKSKELAFSTSMVSGSELTQSKLVDLQNGLTGRVSGLNIQYDGYADSTRAFADTRLMLRGIRSLTGNNQPLLIIDGVPSKKSFSDLNPNEISNVSMLKAVEAVALYGADGANGVIIITTKGFGPKSLREEFRDYAFWKPNFITDENGEAKFEVTYPDNITNWQTYIVGMDKKHRMIKTSKIVKATKPMLAQLSAPQFLLEEDSAIAVGKKINYTASALQISTEFSVNDKLVLSSSESLKANDASISELIMNPSAGTDSIHARFSVKAEQGFADGELRKIPVLKKGTIETVGQFNVLERDTVITVQVSPGAGNISIHIQNNTLDVLLDEIDDLKKYPYYCMEQIASKLTGLAMERKVREELKQSFGNQKEMQKLLEKLQKGQLFDGGWGWWEGNRPNVYITNYIVRALLQLRGDALLETNIRNALLFLNNQLPKLDKYELLESLYTLSEAGHDMDYNVYLQRLTFDSLSQHQQWQMVSVLQKHKLGYEKELTTLLKKKTKTMLGGVHWGINNYWWYRNDVATTVLAYKFFDRVNGYENEKKQIVQYFLEKRKQGRWQNTVESATILSSILPGILKENKNFTSPASVSISGDTNTIVHQFPFSMSYKPGHDDLTVNKRGGGMIYFTSYQQVFNNSPQAVDSNFRVKTYFDNGRMELVKLKAGEKVKMKVQIEVLKDADYVQIEIPVPAGCTYGAKPNSGYTDHREYFRDRVMIFTEKMSAGMHSYEIDLEPRYSGSYTINPAKAELMYFPVFYGRDEIKKLEIVK